MDFTIIVYILLCVVIGGGIVSSFYNEGQKAAAFTALALLILVFTFFGLRWFKDGNFKGTQQGTIPWPPIVNMCPDFLSSWTDSSGNIYCYDASNVYGLKTNTCCNLQSGLTINNIKGQSAFLIKDIAPTAPNKYPLINSFKTAPQNIVGSGDGKYLKWEGVWDGRMATPQNAPLP
jgi:hypothetical protein